MQGRSLAQAKSTRLKQVQDVLSIIFPSPAAPSLVRKIACRLLVPLDHFSTHFPIRLDAPADIYHSTFLPLVNAPPRSVCAARVLTVYDLIPIILPEFCTYENRALIEQVINSAVYADRVMAISESTKSDLCEHTGIDPDRVAVTPLAASAQFYPCQSREAHAEVRSKYGIPDGQYALSLCTLEPRKNIEQVIRSYVDLVRQQRLDDLSLVLVGTKGWDFDHIFDEIKGADALSDKIIITGYLPDEALAPVYSGATMFLYPSLYEGFGLPVLEAMQCGVPVVTSNVSSLPEVVGNAGIMLDPRDGAGLSQAMFDIYSDETLRERLALQGVAHANTFSWERCAKSTIAAYETALAQAT